MLKMKFDFDDTKDFAIRFQADATFIRQLIIQFRQSGEKEMADQLENYLDIASARPRFSLIISDRKIEFEKDTIDEIFSDI